MTTKITEKNISSLANIGVNWQAVVVADGSTGLTAVAGRGYFIDTTSGTITVTLPTSANVGDVIVLKDYARKWATNNVTIASNLFDGGTLSTTFSTNGQTITLVRMDNTRGWSLINDDTTSNLGPAYLTATGGTVVTSGDFKIHTFTGDGCFVVATLGNPGGSDSVDYLVVAGGGGGGTNGGGGAAGGFRYSNSTFSVPGAPGAPLASSTAVPVTATGYPITVGSGGAGAPWSGAPGITSGNPSTFSTITSTAGGFGGMGTPTRTAGGNPGGSGGGSNYNNAPGIGSGNTPPVSPSQGNNGGGASASDSGGGGGGAMAAGSGLGPTQQRQPGGIGAGIPTAFGSNGVLCGSYRYYAGGGGGATQSTSPTLTGNGGTGGGGASGIQEGTAVSGTANTGGGGGGAAGGSGVSGAGGKGIVIIRYKFQ